LMNAAYAASQAAKDDYSALSKIAHPLRESIINPMRVYAQDQRAFLACPASATTSEENAAYLPAFIVLSQMIFVVAGSLTRDARQDLTMGPVLAEIATIGVNTLEEPRQAEPPAGEDE